MAIGAAIIIQHTAIVASQKMSGETETQVSVFVKQRETVEGILILMTQIGFTRMDTLHHFLSVINLEILAS